MPRKAVKEGKGPKKWKIKEPGGKTVGSSTSKAKAEASARAANAAKHGWKPTRKGRK